MEMVMGQTVKTCVVLQKNDGRRMDSQSHPDTSSPQPDSDVPCTRADALAGNASAQFGLGLFCAAGSTQDYAQAAEWYLKAAEQNHHLAQYNLGLMFAHGQGMQPDDATAVTWIRRAANGGDAGAQFDLGNRSYRASANGSETDVAESRIEAYKWYKLAAAQGYGKSADSSDYATIRMSREEVTEGNRRVASFATT